MGDKNFDDDEDISLSPARKSAPKQVGKHIVELLLIEMDSYSIIYDPKLLYCNSVNLLLLGFNVKLEYSLLLEFGTLIRVGKTSVVLVPFISRFFFRKT